MRKTRPSRTENFLALSTTAQAPAVLGNVIRVAGQRATAAR
jgi:hypothetical protein